MSLLGLHLTLLIGKSVPKPAPLAVLQSIKDIEITHNDSQRSGFQISFRAGRPARLGVVDYPLFDHDLLQPFNRVIIMVTFGAKPNVLMDGIITHQQLMPSNEAGASILSIIGEDVSVMMDLEEKKVAGPPMPDIGLVGKIVGSYGEYGLIPVIPVPLLSPLAKSTPSPKHLPFQDGTDLAYLQKLAGRYGYVTYVIPGPAPGTNRFYWGPQIKPGMPQPALSVNLGPSTNVDTVSFRYNALVPMEASGHVQDGKTNKVQAVKITSAKGTPLSKGSALKDQSHKRQVKLVASGPTHAQVKGIAQGMVDQAAVQPVTAEGTLDALRYGHVLSARALVGLRGAGKNYDGDYYVKSVTHQLSMGSYKQSFSLTRQGLGAKLPVVKP